MCKPTTQVRTPPVDDEDHKKKNGNSTTTTTTTTTNTARPRSQQLRLLVSLDSFSSDYDTTTTTTSGSNKDATSSTSSMTPNVLSCIVTGMGFVGFLTGMEMMMRTIFYNMQHVHPLLEEETNRQILARHIGVDTVSCIVVATMGWLARHLNYNACTSPLGGVESRLFTYHPDGFRVSLFFLFYQVKNLYDTIVWNDGPIFVFHHIFSIITAYGAMHPGCGHPYTIFYFGISEFSTAVLCLLANFDDEHGVPGLGDAMPLTKVALGAVFVVLFIVCRCILWPINSYYFGRDIMHALKQVADGDNNGGGGGGGGDIRAKERRGWMKFFLVSLSSMTVLQLLFLGQIFVIAGEEMARVGLF